MGREERNVMTCTIGNGGEGDGEREKKDREVSGRGLYIKKGEGRERGQRKG